MTGPASREVLEVDGRPEAVPQARRWVRGLLRAWHREDVVDDAELLVSELVGNTVLHAPGPVRVALHPDRSSASDEDALRLEVTDVNPALPRRRPPTAGGTTGRGLNLVHTLAAGWGVEPRTDGRPGKVVWCRLLPPAPVSPEADELDLDDIDLDALLASFDDDDLLPAGLQPPEPRHEVVVGEAPVGLVLAAKDHLDGLLREFALATAPTAEGQHGQHGQLGREVLERIRLAVERFGEARGQLRREVSLARGREQHRVLLRFSLPVSAADAGEAYLAALAEADAFARDRRLLSLESPVAFRVLREWYVHALVAALRASDAAEPPPVPAIFEARLLQELEALDEHSRELALAAQLQRVTARLAAATTFEEIGGAALEEGAAALGADGGTLTRPSGPGGRAVTIVERGSDTGLGARYGDRADRPVGPSSVALRSGTAVYAESREQRDELFPHLADYQPGVVSLAAVPLRVTGAVVGALRFSFAAPHVFTSGERAYLEGLAAQTAQAVARDEARRRLTRAESRSRLLAQLGERLVEVRSLDGVLDALAGALLPDLGDWLVVRLADERGVVWTPLVRAADPALSERLAAVLPRMPVLADRSFGPGRVLASGVLDQREVDLSRLRASLQRYGVDQDVLDVLQGDRIQLTVVPLTARGRTVGVVSVGRSGGVPLDEDELAVVADVSRRAATALDNATALTTAVRLELALDAAGVGSYEMHVATGHLVWDDRLFALLDIDPDDFDGTSESFFAKVPPEDGAVVAEAMERAIATVGELAAEYRVLLRSGGERWVQTRGRALPGADGTAERLVGVCVDVTEQRATGARVLASLEHMAEGFLQLDRDGVVHYANAEAERLLQLPRERVLGRRLEQLVPRLVGSRAERLLREGLRTGQPQRFEVPSSRTGTEIEVRVHPDATGLALYLTDVGRWRSVERDRVLERLRLLDSVSEALSRSPDLSTALPALVESLLPALGDVAIVDLEDAGGGRPGLVVGARDPGDADLVRRADALLKRPDDEASVSHRVLSGEPVARPSFGPDTLRELVTDPALLALYTRLDPRYAVAVPLEARGQTLGVLTVVRTGDAAEPFDDLDTQLAVDVGRRAGLLVSAVQPKT